jgi:hypothetical protein
MLNFASFDRLILTCRVGADCDFAVVWFARIDGAVVVVAVDVVQVLQAVSLLTLNAFDAILYVVQIYFEVVFDL